MSHDTSSFPVTDWSLLRRLAGDDEPSNRRLDLGDLLTRYLPPMRRFLVHQFPRDQHQVDDWLQGFVAAKVLESKLLGRADRDRGKFRSFLSNALFDYACDQRRRAEVRERGRIDAFADANALDRFSSNDADPARLFERHWAEHAIAEALRLTKERLYATSRGAAWEVFSRRMLEHRGAPRDYRALSAEFAFETPSQAAIALNTAKRIFRRKLQDVLMEFGATDGDLDAAIAELKNIFQN